MISEQISSEDVTNGYSDFRATVYDADDTTDKSASNVDIERKQKIKGDIFTVITTAAVNILPIVVDNVKHRKDPVPYKQNKADYVRLGISMFLPTVQLIDTLVFNSRLQETIKTKTPFTLSDVRNVVNIVQAYPSTHKVVKDYFSNVSRQANGQQQIITNDRSKGDALVSCVNTISPYIVDKMCDSRYTFIERMSTIIPIKMFGGLVRKFVGTDPKLQHGYDVVTSCIKVADFGSKTFNTAVRSNNNMRTGAANQLGTFLDVVQDLTGMSRGNISRFNDGYYDNWNGGSRFNNF